MARIAMTSGFSLVPEGTQVFRIYNVTYDEEFGKLTVFMVNAQGITHKENFSLKDKNDQPNEKAYNAFSYFAKTALNDFSLTEIDHEDLLGCFIECDIEHDTQPNKNKPDQTITFARLADKRPSDGFEVAKAPTPAAPKKTAPAATGGTKKPPMDLKSLLG